MLSFDNVQNKHQHIKFISFNSSRQHFICRGQHFILQQKTFYFATEDISQQMTFYFAAEDISQQTFCFTAEDNSK